MTLVDLDKAFIDIWKHPSHLPSLLSKWQEMVGEFLKTSDGSDAFKIEFESYLAKWQATLTKNRDLLNTEQQKLKQKLSTGEMKVEPSVLAKKFSIDNL